MRKPSRLLTLAVGLLVATTALPALAAPTDTSFIRGYDDEIRVLVIGIEALEDAERACADLEESEESTEVTHSDDGETATINSPDDEVEVADLCELDVVDATGPNGQVNHGTIVSAFVKALKGMELPFKGKGCLVRHIAQTDWGKGDQQVKTGDVEESTDPETSTEEATVSSVMLEIDEVDCVHGKADRDEAPGKSGEAKGRQNKADRDKEDRGNRPEHAGQGRPDHAGKGKK